jgi:hypothetical protein
MQATTTGTGAIRANGHDGGFNDNCRLTYGSGGGGGGSGGSIYLVTGSIHMGLITAHGGRGGCHGGGDGGEGRIRVDSTP